MTTVTRNSPLLLVRETDGVAIDLAPLQGLWTVDQYLKLTDHTRCLVEFSHGNLEVLPMPTQRHQMILAFLYRVFFAFLQPRGGLVLFAPLRLRVGPAAFREPDLLLLLHADDPRAQNRYWSGADGRDDHRSVACWRRLRTSRHLPARRSGGFGAARGLQCECRCSF
jgi:hypothetical protein